MKRWRSSLVLKASIAVVLCAASFADARPDDKSAPPSDPARVSPPATPQKGSGGGDGDYVGSETCITCHADEERRSKDTVMGKAMAHPRTPEEARGCESCHGPGRAHVEAGGGKDTIPLRFGKDSPNSVAEQNAACEECHSRGDHLFWKGSPHESRGMACVTCHQVKKELRVALSSDTRFNAPLSENTGLKTKFGLRCGTAAA